MGSVCAEHHHKLHHPHKPLEIPPRKLHGRKAAESRDSVPELSLRKFLPGSGGDDSSDSDSDPYSSDHFRMFEFKVRRCTRSRSHDWTDCPFVHPGEKARRRDPRKYSYSGTVCSEYRRGSCSRGDHCEFAHGVFECWLHPSRYRTEACKDGKNCKRKVCFFAHTPRQLRVLPEPDDPLSMPDNKDHAELVSSTPGHTHCCVLCHSLSNSLSPTSTLLGTSHLSPPSSPSASLSPPLSPLKNWSLTGLYPDRFLTSLDPIELNRGGGSGRISYKVVLNDIMNSFDSIQMNERIGSHRNLPWLNIDNMTAAADDQPQLVLSPSTPNPSTWRNCFGTNSSSIDVEWGHGDGTGSTEPDIGWVDELLM